MDTLEQAVSTYLEGMRVDSYLGNPSLKRLFERHFGSHDYFELMNHLAQRAGEIGPKITRTFSEHALDEKCTFLPSQDPMESGRVELPAATKLALDWCRQAGFFGVTIDGAFKGEEVPALPHATHGAITYLLSQASPSLVTILGLTEDATYTLAHFGPKNIVNGFVPNVCTTDLSKGMSGAMLITEERAGSDVKSLSTAAQKQEGSYLLNGKKIFISNPDADVKIVLARSGSGPNDLSVFFVPKKRSDGSCNGVTIEKLEEKMGINSSPTGTVNLSNAEGHLIGEENRGFAIMYDLMFRARLGVAAQSLGICERAVLESVRYLSEREQPKKLIELPSLQSILSSMRVSLEAATSLVFDAYSRYDSVAHLILSRTKDKGAKFSEQEEKTIALSNLLVPLAKYRASELAVELSLRALQNFGGIGYMKGTTVERLYRDAPITTIYEGTSEIQRNKALEYFIKGGMEQFSAIITDRLASIDSSELAPQKNSLLRSLDDFAKTSDPKQIKKDKSFRDGNLKEFIDKALSLYESSLVLEDAQFEMNTYGDFRKTAMAQHYFAQNFLAHDGTTLSRFPFGVKFFPSIIGMGPITREEYRSIAPTPL